MFKGSLVALVTPMHDDGAIDLETLELLIDWHLDQKTDGFVIAGSTGESGTLDNTEKVKLVHHVVNYVGKQKPVIAGVGLSSTSGTIALSKEMMEAGADAILVMTPAYIRPAQEGLFQHYKLLSKAVHIPIILYNVPARTAVDLLPDTVERLSKISNIIGIKEAVADIKRVKLLHEHCQDAIDIYSGDDASCYDTLLAGAKGVISVVANVAPNQMHKLCRAVAEGDKASAKKINDSLVELNKQLSIESNPIPVKWALTYMGKIQGGIRLPLTQLNEQYHDGLQSALERAGIQPDALTMKEVS